MIQREVSSGIFSVKMLKLKSKLERDTLITSETKDLVQQYLSKVSSIQCNHDEHVLFTGYKVPQSEYFSGRKEKLAWLKKASNSLRTAFREFIKDKWLVYFPVEEFPNCSVPTLHDIRATKATHLYKSCKSEVIVQKYLGHEDLRTTQLYIDMKN